MIYQDKLRTDSSERICDFGTDGFGTVTQVFAALCLAENALGPGSYRPDDIIRMHSGKTVEVIDTGALALCHSAIALLSISL
jgi:hypothetical protein